MKSKIFQMFLALVLAVVVATPVFAGGYKLVSKETFPTFSVYKTKVVGMCYSKKSGRWEDLKKNLNFFSGMRRAGSSANVKIETECGDELLSITEQGCSLDSGEIFIERLRRGWIHTIYPCELRPAYGHPVLISIHLSFERLLGAKLQRSRVESLNGDTLTIEKHLFKLTELDGVVRFGDLNYEFDANFPEGFVGKKTVIVRQR